MAVQIRASGAPVSEEALRALEAALPAPLPDDYRQFLARHNGGRPEPGEFDIRWADPALGAGHASTEVGRFFSVDGRPPRLLDQLQQFGDELPRGYLAIGTDPGGDELLLGLEGDARGKVYYRIHDLLPEYDPTDPATLGFVADSFDAFLAGLYAADE